MKLYEVKNVNVAYGKENNQFEALKNVSFTLDEKERIAIVGPSGSGKSTLLNVLGGLEKISSGEIWFEGEELSKKNNKQMAEIRLKKFGFVFQAFYLMSSLCVKDNIVLPTMMKSNQVDNDFFGEVVSKLGLYNKLKCMPNELSGGEQQRVAIARALINKPKVIFADEPSGNLDSENGKKVFELLFECAEKFGQTLIYVTHDEQKAMLANRIINIKDGAVYEKK